MEISIILYKIIIKVKKHKSLNQKNKNPIKHIKILKNNKNKMNNKKLKNKM
jgi:hypothetical protein